MTVEERIRDLQARSANIIPFSDAEAREIAEREEAERLLGPLPKSLTTKLLANLSGRLADWADEAEKILRAKGEVPRERCASCAFTAGTFPNTRAPLTALDAVKCLKQNHSFGCHHDKGPNGQPTRLCGAFSNIIDAGNGPEKGEASWRWSDEMETKP